MGFLYIYTLRSFAFIFDLCLKYTWDPIYYATGGDECWDFLTDNKKHNNDARLPRHTNKS